MRQIYAQLFVLATNNIGEPQSFMDTSGWIDAMTARSYVQWLD